MSQEKRKLKRNIGVEETINDTVEETEEEVTEEDTAVETVTFLSVATKGIIWDGPKGRPLCRFEDGRLTTSKPYIIKKLRALGYGEE